jgi:sterol desaturase/sphingolipid hydroxylase (fatty acid hydroxylase superfamily)
MILVAIGIALALILIERLWPARELPTVRGWWGRVALVNISQAGIVFLAGRTWDAWMQNVSLLHLRDHFGDVTSALIAYLVSCFVYYWWHRLRHESQLFWRLCHQLHHSPRRIEIVTSFYKHPVEITINSILSSAIVYLLLGCSVTAAVYYTVLTAAAEYFYHWNIRTPYWLGWFVQRPESHRVHHQYQRHTNNYADLPVFDWMFGTLENAREEVQCGFDTDREQQFGNMMAFKDVHATPAAGTAPTCFGCRKRWICAATSANAVEPAKS